MLGTGQFLEGKLSTIITPQLIESMKLAAMPAMELRSRILREAEENPALEIVCDPAASRELPPQPPGALPFYRDLPLHSYLAGGSISAKEKSDAHRDFFEKVLARPETLQEHLVAGLAEIKLAPKTEKLARAIISSLDSNGFLAIPPESLAGAESLPILEEALSVVQRLDPAGCAAKDALESLAIQAEIRAESHESAEEGKLFAFLALILRKSSELSGKARAENLSAALKRKGATLSAEEAGKLLSLLRTLEPYPGRNFAAGEAALQEAAQYIVPDIVVAKKDGVFYAKMNDDEIPVIGISKAFQDFEKKGAKSALQGTARKEDERFVRESLKNAKWFINALKRRRKTLLKVAAAVIARQKLFFERGPKFLQPLRMLDVAEDLELHEATVSRAVSGKYLQCEWGVFSLRYFFSSGTSARSADGTGNSKESVKEIIREMVNSSQKKLSDREIAEKLSERGIKIARRTVAKYKAEIKK